MAELDERYKIDKPFSPEIKAISQSFQTIIRESRASAASIVSYATKFATITRICTDKKNTVARRKQLINKYIADSKGFEEKATKFQEKFSKLKEQFGVFHGRFIAWAKLSQAQLDVDITQLNRDIKDLTTKIEGLQKKLWISGAVIALGATVLIPVMALAGPLAPFVAVAGLCFAGITIATILAITAKIKMCNQEIVDKNAAIETKRQGKIDIDASVSTVENLVGPHLTVFTNNIDVLEGVWTHLVADSVKIQGFLELANDLQDMPEKLVNQLKLTTDVYTGMVHYLEQYARGG